MKVLQTMKSFIKVISILILSTVIAAAYPNKPIEKTITFKAGGAADIAGRLAAKAAEKVLSRK